MRTLHGLLLGMEGDAGEVDDTAYTLKVSNPAQRRRRLHDSVNLRYFSKVLDIPPLDDLVEAFNPDWSIQRSPQANDELYKTVTKVKVAQDEQSSWNEYASYLGWCGDAAASNLFYLAATRLYRDAALNYLATLDHAPNPDIERPAALLAQPQLLDPLVEILDGFSVHEGTLALFGRRVDPKNRRFVIGKLDAFVAAVDSHFRLPDDPTGSDTEELRANPFVESLVMLIKGAGVAIFDPKNEGSWIEKVPGLQHRLRNYLDWLRSRCEAWSATEAGGRLERARRNFDQQLKELLETNAPTPFGTDTLRVDVLTKLERLASEGPPFSIDVLEKLVEKENSQFLAASVSEGHGADLSLYAFLKLVEASLALEIKEATRNEILAASFKALADAVSGQG